MALQSPYDVLVIASAGASLAVFGFYLSSRFIAYAGCVGMALTLLFCALSYPTFMANHDIFKLTLLLGGLSLIVNFQYLVLKLFHVDKDTVYGHIEEFTSFEALFFPFFWIRAYIILGSHYYFLMTQAKTKLSSLFDYLLEGKQLLESQANLELSALYQDSALALYYALSGLFFSLAGFAYKKRYVRNAGFLLLFLALLKFILVIKK